MPDKIIDAASKLASLNLHITDKEDIVIVEIVIDVPVQRIIGRQIIGCFGIGEFQRGSIYDKIAQSVQGVLKEATVDELLVLHNNFKQNQK